MEKEYNSSSSHKEFLAKVACMCAFRNRSHQDLLYLPLALNIIGSQLRSNGVDLEKWNIKLSRLDTTMVEEFKEGAVKKIVEESYQKLSDKLRLLFLDVALFMVPYCQSHKEDGVAVELLGFMHECRPDTIKRNVKDLRRLCFLESGFFDVHDVFLEFARSIPEASSMYYCKKRNIAGLQVASELSMMAERSVMGLRALILEVDEECKRFDFPEGLSRVKVVVVRECKSLEVLGLAGLKSLVSLEIQDCPRLRLVDLDPGHAYTLKCVRWPKSNQRQQGSFQRSLLEMSQAGSGMPVKWLINKVWCSMLALGGWHHRPPLNGFMNLARQLKALQVLRLEQTGITSLGDLSSCWPQLRVLEVLEGHLEVLELGNLPNLKQFFYGDRHRYDFVEHFSKISRGMRSNPRLLRKPNLLAGCPELEEVRICEPCYEDGMGTLILPPNLRSLHLKHVYNGEPELSDLTSAAQSLEEIMVRDHQVLQSIVFMCQFSRLVKILLECCPNLITINGLEWLPNLRDLTVFDCAELQSVGNLEALRMLESLRVTNCPVLSSLHLDTMSSPHVDTVNMWGCPNLQFLASDLEHLTALRSLSCNVLGNVFNLKNLASLKWLMLKWECEGQAANPLSLCCYDEKAISEQARLQRMKHMPLLVVAESEAPHLWTLNLHGVQNLVSLAGVHFFCTLRALELHHLPKLTCLQGLESLINLSVLCISHCPAVTELPSLCSLVKIERLSITHCANLLLLEGCRNMPSLKYAYFEECESLEHLELEMSVSLHFKGCKFASIKAMLRWVLDEKVSISWWFASLEALTWELTHHLLEKPRERMDLAEQLVETLGVYLMKELPALTHLDDCFDFKWWFYDLKEAWRLERKSYPKILEKLMEGLGRVPLMDVLQQCQSDAHFRTSVANCFIETHPRLLHRWIAKLMWRHMFYYMDPYP